MGKLGRPEVPRVTVSCAGCGAELVKRVTDLARCKTGRMFCSKECRDKTGCKPRRGWWAPCGQCGKELYQTPAVRKIYCNKVCHDQAQCRDKVTSVCPICRKLFEHQRLVKRIYCGRECYETSRNSTSAGRDHNGKPVRWTHEGYLVIYEPTHPRAYRHGYVLEHRFVMEQKIGRLLEPGEVVHHVNSLKWDNRPENLDLMEHGAHSSLTAAELRESRATLLAELEEYRSRYGMLT